MTVHSSSITSPPITIHEAEDKSSFLVGLETFNDTHLLITYNTGKVLKLNKKGSQIEFTEFFRIFPEGHVKGIDEELSQVLCSKVSKDCSYIISSIDDPKILIHDMLNPKAEPRKISLKSTFIIN